MPAKNKMPLPRYQSILNSQVPIANLPNGQGSVRVIAGEFGTGWNGGAPGGIPLSSYRVNAQGEVDTLVQAHALYDALGSGAASRQVAYRELFRAELEPGLMDEIRRSINGNFALGDNRFADQVAATLGRRTAPSQSGRPRKVLIAKSDKLF